MLYLPQGPVLSTSTNSAYEDEVISTLSSSSNSIIVRVNYRLSNSAQYPTPVHDVLAGYDWVLQHMLPKTSRTSRLGVCGELVGGSLATTLSLTECRLGGNRISAAAVNSPILDWLFRSAADDAFDQAGFEDHQPSQRSKRKKQPPTRSWDLYARKKDLPTGALLRARRLLFRKPEDFFDRFASPILFFRSPDAEIPIYTEEDSLVASLEDIIANGRDEAAEALNELNPLDPDTSQQHYIDPNLYISPDLIPFEPSAADFAALNADRRFTSPTSTSQAPRNPMYDLLPRRKYHRVYPPTDSGLRLPDMLLTAGRACPLRDQATEFVALARRSIARDLARGRRSGHYDDALEEARPVLTLEEALRWRSEGASDYAAAEAERRVELREGGEGVGLWAGPTREVGWRREVEYVGDWFRRVLAE